MIVIFRNYKNILSPDLHLLLHLDERGNYLPRWCLPLLRLRQPNIVNYRAANESIQKYIHSIFWYKKNKEINKEIITNSFSAIVMPSAAFFSKDSFKPSRILSARQETEKKFKKFSFWNSFLFFVVGNITKSIV